MNLQKRSIDQVTRNLLHQHYEALVIFVDQDRDDLDEFKIGICTKTKDGGMLLSCLPLILEHAIEITSKTDR